VRPIAFKPVVPNRGDRSSPAASSFTPTLYDDGYSSQGTSRGCSNSVSASSGESSDTYYASPIHTSTYPNDLPATQHEQSLSPDLINYEKLLQEKESEILQLRRTMELNESAMVRVHEHKRIEWENQMKELTQEYHRRLRLKQDQSNEKELDLRDIISKLEMDNRQLSVNIQQQQIDQDRQQQLSIQLHELKQRHADMTQRLSQETCESDKLRHRNKELEATIQTLQEKLVIGTAEQNKLQEKVSKSSDTSTTQTKQLSERLQQLENEILQERGNFCIERQKWKEEKEKVLQYQKQLQKTYSQMYRRNNELEQQLCRINSRRQARRESLQNNMDRFSLLSVDIETTPESFC